MAGALGGIKETMKKRIIVAATGASGMPLFIKCLELIREAREYEIWVIMSREAQLTMQQELIDGEKTVHQLADQLLSSKDIGSGPASGSFAASGMLIVPCSMKTVAGICGGYAENLILRAADVTIKEQRPLILAARETPFNSIHLRNLHELSCMSGVHIVPPMMTFYHKPKTIDEMVYHLAAKLVEPFGVEAKEYRRWKGI